MLQLHSVTSALASSRGGDAVTLYVKAPQWHDALYVAVGAVGDGGTGTEVRGGGESEDMVGLVEGERKV